MQKRAKRERQEKKSIFYKYIIGVYNSCKIIVDEKTKGGLFITELCLLLPM